jgi:predicted methyltransferase
MNFRYFHACQLPFVVACITSVFTLTALAQTPAAPATPTTPATPAAAAPVNAGPYVPSPETAVAELLKLANIGPNDVVIDLGSGDGRIVLTAAKVYGARGFGVEIQENLVKLSNEAAKKEGLAERVKFINQDLFKTDISSATVLARRNVSPV